MNEQQLATLLSNQQATVQNQDAFFTNYDRRAQINDEYGLKAEVIQNGIKIAVVHAHLERIGSDDVITKAHVKSDHYGAKLFDLSPIGFNSGIILGYAFGPGYKVRL